MPWHAAKPCSRQSRCDCSACAGALACWRQHSRTFHAQSTGVLAWGGRLLSLYESSLPHELDPTTLDTLGESTVGGQLETPVLGAHYRIVTRTPPSDTPGDAAGQTAGQARDWVAFSANTGLGGTELIFYEFAEGPGGKLAAPPVRAPLPGVSMALVHDIAGEGFTH